MKYGCTAMLFTIRKTPASSVLTGRLFQTTSITAMKVWIAGTGTKSGLASSRFISQPERERLTFADVNGTIVLTGLL